MINFWLISIVLLTIFYPWRAFLVRVVHSVQPSILCNPISDKKYGPSLFGSNWLYIIFITFILLGHFLPLGVVTVCGVKEWIDFCIWPRNKGKKSPNCIRRSENFSGALVAWTNLQQSNWTKNIVKNNFSVRENGEFWSMFQAWKVWE